MDESTARPGTCEQLAVGLAHELENRLAAIHGATQVLARHLPEGDPSRPVFDEIALQIRLLDGTLQDLLRFARPTRASPVPTDVRDLLRSVARETGGNPEVARPRLRVDAPPELVVPLDPKLLSQALAHLVLHAAQAQQIGGEIVLSARREGARAVFEVAHNGQELAPEPLGSIFEPFAPLRSHGAGLGLAIARQSVEAHAGVIAARRSATGGTILRIELPLGPG